MVPREVCPYAARAWWGGRLVAETRAAVRLEQPGRSPELYFPLADIDLEPFHDGGDGPSCSFRGPSRLWDLDGVPDATTGPTTRRWAEEGGAPSDGREVLTSYPEVPEPAGWLSEMATFDHDRVRVELVDAGPGADERDVTVKRFPTWGDASDLIDVLDVRPAEDGSYVSVARASHRRPVVEGSQMLGQAIVAAGRRCPGRRVVSAHMVFLRAADASEPLRVDLAELSSGRTFVTFAVHVSQSGRRCASGVLLLDVTAPDVIRHSAAPPGVAGPYESEPYDMSVTGRDIRVVDGAYTDDLEAGAGPPSIDAWVRFREVPDDPCLHAALLAQFTGHMSIATALRPHEGIGQREAHRTLSTAINAIGISFHEEVDAARWMLYHHESTFAGSGMTHSECRVHDADGVLLASFTVDAMVRRFPERSTAVDDRSAL